MHIEFVEMI